MPIFLDFAVPFGIQQTPRNAFLPVASDGPPDRFDPFLDDRFDHAYLGDLHRWASEPDVSADVKEAAQKTFEAWRHPTGSPKRVGMARRALQVCPHMSEAFYLLGCEAETREEALRWFEKGAEAGPLLVGTQEFEAARREGHAFERPLMRSFYRCLFGAANTLRKMGRYKEAYAKYKRLLEFDANPHAYSSAINPYPSFVECLLGLGRWGEAAAYLYSQEEEMLALAKKPSSYLTWTYTRILVALKARAPLGKVPELQEQPVLKDLLTAFWDGVCATCARFHSCCEREPPSAERLARGHVCVPDPVLALLSGDSLPEGRDPPLVEAHSEAAARSYVRQFGKHWRAEPEALAKLLAMDRIVRSRCGGNAPDRECPLKVIEEFGCPCCGFSAMELLGASPSSNSKSPSPPAAAAAGTKAAARGGPSSSPPPPTARQPASAPAAPENRSGENEPPPNDVQACGNCGRSGDGLMRCGACRQAHYCGERCQRAHWGAHKAACKEAAQRAAAAPSAATFTARLAALRT
eukprot:tig00000093_g3641.t1